MFRFQMELNCFKFVLIYVNCRLSKRNTYIDVIYELIIYYIIETMKYYMFKRCSYALLVTQIKITLMVFDVYGFPNPPVMTDDLLCTIFLIKRQTSYVVDAYLFEDPQTLKENT